MTRKTIEIFDQEFEYTMSKEMANEYLKNRKGTEKNKQNQEYLCQVVNSDFGIKGYCTKVIID